MDLGEDLLMDLQVVQVIHLQYRQRPLRVTMAATGLLEVHNSVEVEVEVETEVEAEVGMEVGKEVEVEMETELESSPES